MAAVALSHLAVGERGRVTSMTLSAPIRQRLMEMGLTVGTECAVIRFAPLGDPMEVRVRGYHLSLRKSEADGVWIERL